MHVARGGVVEADHRIDVGGKVDAEWIGRLGRPVVGELTGREQRAEELLAVVGRSARLDVEHLVVADRRRDLHMGIEIDREIGEIEALEVLLGVERDTAFDLDVVAEDLEVLQIGRAVLLLCHVELEVGRTSCGLGPAHAAEEQPRVGEVGGKAHGRRGSLAKPGDRHGDGGRALDQMVDLKAEFLARVLIERGRHLDRRLAIIGGVEDALPGKLGGDTLDLNWALGLDRLLGDIHVERAAFDGHVADEIGGNGLVEPRHSPQLDLLEGEVVLEGH